MAVVDIQALSGWYGLAVVDIQAQSGCYEQAVADDLHAQSGW